MTPGVASVPRRPLTRWQRFLARLVPAWRRELEAQDVRAAHTEAIRLRAIRARMAAESATRQGYRAMGDRLTR
jgi:hypothetical protein